jgi:hypothetical protein
MSYIFLEYRMMDKVQEPSNSVCYTPSSEPFRIYMSLHVYGRAYLDGEMVTRLLLAPACSRPSAGSCSLLARSVSERLVRVLVLNLQQFVLITNNTNSTVNATIIY